MNREVQAWNPQPGAARGREGGPTSWEEELRRVIRAGARQDTLAGQSAIINDYIRNSRQVFVTKRTVGKRHAEWIKITGETEKAWKITYYSLSGKDVIFLPKSQVQFVERGDEIIGLLVPGWLVRARRFLERIVKMYLYEEIEKERDRRRKR
jgi:ribosomal protein L13